MLAAYRVDLPYHWCCGCLGIGPRWSLLAAWCSVLLAVPCLRSTERNADPQTPNPRALSRRSEKRAERPQTGTKTSSALHDIPSINMCMANDCGGGLCRCCLDERHGSMAYMYRSAYLIETGDRQTLLRLAGVNMPFAFAVQREPLTHQGHGCLAGCPLCQ